MGIYLIISMVGAVWLKAEMEAAPSPPSGEMENPVALVADAARATATSDEMQVTSDKWLRMAVFTFIAPLAR